MNIMGNVILVVQKVFILTTILIFVNAHLMLHVEIVLIQIVEIIYALLVIPGIIQKKTKKLMQMD